MKITNKSIALLLTLFMVLAICPAVYAEEAGITALKVNPYGGKEADIDTVDWFVSGNNHFLFLPADVDLAAAKVYFTASDGVALDGEAVVSGESAAAFTDGDHTLTCGEESLPLTVMRSENLPAIFIETESGSLDYLLASKENKESATIRVYENGELTLDTALKQIKGRGNSTWAFPKLRS